MRCRLFLYYLVLFLHVDSVSSLRQEGPYKCSFCPLHPPEFFVFQPEILRDLQNQVEATTAHINPKLEYLRRPYMPNKFDLKNALQENILSAYLYIGAELASTWMEI